MFMVTKKKGFVAVLIAVFLIATLTIKESGVAYALQENDGAIIYQDGIKYEVLIDENMNIVVTAETESGDEIVTQIDEKGDFTFTNEMEDETYHGKINELSEEHVDVDVTNETGEIVETYRDIEQLQCNDEYVGQGVSFTLTTGVVITFAQVLSVLISIGVVIVVSGLTFIAVTKFVQKVNELSSANRTKAKDLYYKAYINGNKDYGSNIFIHHKGMKVTAAANYLNASNSNSVYSFTSLMAKAAVTKMGYAATAIENHYYGKTSGWYYDHYHPVKSGKRPHSFFGTGKLASNYGGNIG